MKRTKTKLIIVFLLITMVLIVSIGVILYATTDMFKSSESLFKKYIGQNLKDIVYVLDVSEEEETIDTLQNNDFSENADINLKYLENQNDKEEVFTLEEEGVIENVNEKSYRNIKISYDNEQLSRIELLNENDIYGLRLANLVQQFVSVKNENITYFVSSLGYDGEYFSEKLNKANISGLFNFSDEEILNLTNNYIKAIFTDINPSSYTSKNNVIITLSNNQSVTTTAYTLTITKNDLDKIFERVLNQAMNDEIILSKIDEVDNKIKEFGMLEPEGKSLRELYVAKLQELSNGIQYEGEDDRKIIITVYEEKGKTVRTAIQTMPQENQYILDIDEKESGKELTLQITKLTEEGTDIKNYSYSKTIAEDGYARTLTYSTPTENLETDLITTKGDNQIKVEGKLTYNSDKIYSLDVAANANVTLSTGSTSAISFNNNNNIILNDQEPNRVPQIWENLQNRFIKSLEDSQSRINSKLLNNVLNWIDEREQQKAIDRQNQIDTAKQRFNNQFTLYAGENLTYDHIKRLMSIISENMTEYNVVNGSKIRIGIQEGSQNQQKAESIVKALDDRHTYNVTIHTPEDGYVDYIDIEVYVKPKN